ncbi:MAG: type II secretion system protein GspI [Gammaproteobacteria bacterium]|nr:type II secretion system protein GspI [Gammaproteobacteria bacterium]
MTRRATHRGFTLIEVLIALVIMAVALTLGFSAVQGGAVNLARIEERTLVDWALENTLTDLRLRGSTLEPGLQRAEEFLRGRHFEILTEVTKPAGLPVLALSRRLSDASNPAKILATRTLRVFYAPPLP